MRINHNYLLLLLLGISLFSACKKDDPDPQSPTSSFNVSKLTAVVDEEVQFSNTSGNATAFKWSFGDGTTSTEVSPKKSYSTSENFTVTLIATGAGGSNTAISVVKVLPFCTFTVENEATLIANTPVQFTNSSKGAASYQWSFGDAANSTSTAQNPAFTYPTGGTYTVTLKAVSAVGESTFSKTITVTGAPVVKELFHIEYGTNLIKKLSLDGSGTSTTVLDITGKAGAGMALDAVNNKIYFSDFEVTGTGNIWRMNLDGSGLTAIVANLTDPYGVAVDPAGGKIYWADDLGNISRANLDGTNQQIGLVNIPSGQMRAIALDPENNKMYFYEVNIEVLYVANMDGTNVTPLLTGTYGYGILVDTVHDKLYYDDQNAAKLFQVNLDGTGQVTIDADGTRIYGMAIDYSDNKLYWSGRDNGNLTRANLDGSSPEILKSGLTSPRGIALKQ
jgi:PKD repeat protein